MNFALLGVDDESLPLAAAAVAAGHALVWQGDLGAAPVTSLGGLSGVEDNAEQWEDLLVADTADAVIIGRGTRSEELRTRQVQELARLGRPMLVTFPLFDSVLTYFEIDMSRTEGKSVLQHYNPLCWAASLRGISTPADGDHPKFGRVEQIAATRWLSDRNRPEVLRHFARDVELLGQVAGKLNRIGAHAAAGSTADYSALSVQLLGSGERPVRWSVEPPESAEGLSLTFICERGRETVAFDAAGRITTESSEEIAAAAIARFVPDVAANDDAASTWPEALHAMELADSIEISLRRGRMIDVHDQQLTEQLAFKGTMAAAGCGLLMVLIPATLFVGWVAGLMGVPVAEYWPHVLLLILTLFLGVQFLPKLLYDAPSKRDDSENGGPAGR